MIELLLVGVVALLVIAAASVGGPRLGIAAPLVLVAIGVAASFLPVFDSTHIEPEWILEGVLPPLLYSSAVSMPDDELPARVRAISGLSVVLVDRHLARARRVLHAGDPRARVRLGCRARRDRQPDRRCGDFDHQADGPSPSGSSRSSTVRACSTTRPRWCCCAPRSSRPRRRSRSRVPSAHSPTRWSSRWPSAGQSAGSTSHVRAPRDRRRP